MKASNVVVRLNYRRPKDTFKPRMPWYSIRSRWLLQTPTFGGHSKMAKDKAAKAVGKEQRTDKESKKAKSNTDGSKLKTNGDAPLKPKAGPSSENSTVTTKSADKSISKKDKADKKGKKKADTSVVEVNGSTEEDWDENAILLREIKSLGGTEEDFEMLKDVDTDNEEDAPALDTTSDDVGSTFPYVKCVFLAKRV